jgi:hypothetical protein
MRRQAPGCYRYLVAEIVVTDGERNAPLNNKSYWMLRANRLLPESV